MANVFGSTTQGLAGFATNTAYTVVVSVGASNRQRIYVPGVANAVFGFDSSGAPTMVSLGSAASQASSAFDAAGTASAVQSTLTTAIAAKFTTPSGTTQQYVRGDGTLAAFPTIPAAQVNADWSAASGLPQILNKPTIPTIAARVFSTPTFSSMTTATQLSTTRDAEVWYDIDASVTISILAGQSVTATLTYADNSAMTTNPVVLSAQTTSNSGLLGLTQANTLKVGGIVPAGKYRKVTFAVTNSATTPTTLKAGQEVLL